MSLELIALLVATGLVAGGVSAIAGGSGLITFPVLLAVGLPPTVANATNFVSVTLGNVAALPAYLNELKRYQATAVKMVIAGGAGGIIGSFLLLYTSNAFFKGLVPWLIFLTTVLLAFGKPLHKLIVERRFSLNDSSGHLGYVLIFLVSIYGGYFGAGLGVIVLATLSIIGVSDFHEANALKNVTNAVIGILGVIIFTASDLVSWPHALSMMVGSAMGGYLGIRLARYVPSEWLSKGVVLLGVILTIYYFVTI